MTVDHRIIDEAMRVWIACYPCGCAYIWNTREQVAMCPGHPEVQLWLPW